jgi:hypothetical protein
MLDIVEPIYMMKFDKITNENYIMYAMKHYNNPSCSGIEEFYEDMNRIKYLKKLFQTYLNTGVLKERLILNHIIILQNVLGAECANRILFFKLTEPMHSPLKTFLVFLNTFPQEGIPEIDIIGIPLDESTVAILRSVGKDLKP